ncbi:MAG: response regulator [Rhodanobacteraceae bacterium]|nr:response regulator [Rhodanobacteraceae bacterium]
MLAACAAPWQALAASAALAPPVFEVYGTEQGLPSRQVQVLAQDADARLWIGTANGLVRFDGHRFNAYPARLDHEHALASTSVEALHVDAQGQVWVATQGGHLARWRAGSDDFERIDLRTVQRSEPLELWSLTSTPGRLWAGSYGAGLIEFDADGRLLAQHRASGDDGGHLFDVLGAPDGAVWLVTLDRQLWRFDPGTDTLAAVVAAPGESQPAVYGLAWRDGAPWFSTRDGRICRVDRQRIARCDPLPLLALPGRARMLLPGARGDWIGGLGELLRMVDGQPQRIEFIPGSRGGVPQQALWTALADRDGGLWLGSSGGGLLQLPASADRFRAWQPRFGSDGGLRDGRVRGVAEDARGRVWIATLNAGLHRLIPATGAIDRVALPGTDQQRVWAVLADGDEGIWVGHQDGLLRAHVDDAGQLRPWRQWTADDLTGGLVDLLHRDREGQVWAAAMGSGVNRIDPASGRVERLSFAANALEGSEVQQIGEGFDARTWVATDHGLYARTGDGWQPLIGSARVDAWAIAGPDALYAMVDGQLARYRWRSGLYRDEDWAPRSFVEMQTVGALEWRAGVLWLSGPQGLYRYFPESERLEAFDTRDGLPTREFSDRPAHVDAQGMLWLGSEDGVVRVDLDHAAQKPPPAALRFEHLRVADGTSWRELAPLAPATLAAEDRDLRVAVRLASLARPHAQRFSFRVLGWERDFSAPSGQPERYLGTLPAGDYVLEVRAWDGHGQAAANALQWPFRVQPPWWRGEPALLAYGLLLLWLLVAGWHWRRRRQRAAAVLAEARRQAQWAERLAAERTALMAELSHEIRNPLNGVLGMARLLQEQPLANAARHYLELLQDAGRQLARLLDDMLDWSRLQARSEALATAPVAVYEALAGLLAHHAAQAQARGLGFRCEIDPQIGVRADALRLRQIAENLIGNALKFTARGEVAITAEVAGECMRLRVRDTGPGLSQAQVERLFQPFERVGDERAAPGTGLGLAISRNLAERMGGRLWVESEPGTGSCFVLELAAAELPAPQPAVCELAGAPAAAALAGLNWLVVDDDATAREWMQALLTGAGARVRCEADALSALIAMEAQIFDAALVDWDLPGMSGVELARVLRSRFPTIPLVAVTGRVTPADRTHGIEAGFAAHVAKPVDPAALLAAVQRCCAGNQSRPPGCVGLS